ncbi:hypothetical protein KCU81_g1959, partial [Aureobasidium melanogenum]|uniref:FHA domain-containing protein n=1 Tax=Aureobasidium melanogenum (strain CBS 110374) TaxID=1043003 RepID=A0A074VP79_AURM1
MMAPSSHTQGHARVTVSLQVYTPKGAPSTGPTSRTLLIPEHEPVLIGRASLTKNRDPTTNNALFTCAVMSRSHATLSAPNGPYGPVYLEDTDSMHGVYVNGRKIARTEIHPLDNITFGTKVSRAEGTHDGVMLTVTNVTRTGATRSDPIDLCGNSSKTMPPASYRVPDYETDSSKDDTINTTSEKPSAMQYIDLDPVYSPARSHDVVHSEDEHDDTQDYFNGPGSDSEFDSDCGASDYPENPDEFDYDEQSHADSDGSRSPGSALAEDADDTQLEQEDSELDDVPDFHEEPEILPAHVTNTETFQTKVTYTQGNEKAHEPAEIMSLPWILEPSDRWNMSAVTLTPNSIMPKVPSPSILQDTELAPVSQGKKNVDAAGAAAQDTVKDTESQDASLKAQQSDKELDNIVDELFAKVDSPTGTQRQRAVEDNGLEDGPIPTSVPTPTATELFAKVDSPTGSKRKRDIEDDGHEDVPAPSTDRKLLKLKFNKQHILKARPQNTSRPVKRAKRSTAKFALGAFAGAIGGVATVVGVLMTPQCEQLLANWPIA